MSISTFCGMILSTKYARPRKNVHRSTEIAAPVWETEWLFCSTLSGQPSIGTPKGCLLPADALFYLNIVNDKIFLAFTAPILRCVKRNTYLCKIVRIPRRGYSKRQIILSFTIISQFGRKVNVLNVVFREDKLRSKEKKGIHNLGLIRRFVMFIIKLLKVYYHRSMKWVRNKNRKKSGNRDPCDLCQGIGCV